MTALKPLAISALLATTALTQPGIAQTAPVPVTVNDLLATYQADGFDFIEIVEGPTQILVEATMDGITIEVVYDTETGVILAEEIEDADDDDEDDDDDDDDDDGDDDEDDDDE